LQAAALSGGIKPAAPAAAQLRITVPNVTNGNRSDAVPIGLLHGQDHIDVLLTSPADAEKSDADAFVGPADLGIAGSVHSHGGGGRNAGRLQKITSILHRKTPKM